MIVIFLTFILTLIVFIVNTPESFWDMLCINKFDLVAEASVHAPVSSKGLTMNDDDTIGGSITSQKRTTHASLNCLWLSL